MSNIIPFNFHNNSVRVIEKDGEPWFVAKDVAELLGYAKPRNAISLHCRGALKQGIPTASGDQEVTLIPERDVYRLIMRSKLPEAEAFEEWVVGEVLPSIRKSGKYEVQQQPLSQLEILGESVKALIEQDKKIKALENSHSELESKFEKLKESTSILPSRPANAESISFIRIRINRKYGLPDRIINEVINHLSYSPKPAGQVRNTHENAGNTTYTVWYSADVTKCFKRFVSESEMVTKTQAVNPEIEGRFKLVLPEKETEQ